MAGFNMDDYVDVAQRIHNFYERFPDGRLTTIEGPQVIEIGGRPFIAVHAQAFRTPDDLLPGDGWAWEPVPGPTQFTKDSELMNAQTAAWGRAIVALGFETKKIASRQEVQARQGNRPDTNGTAATARKVTEADEKKLLALVAEKGGDVPGAQAAMDTARGQDNYPDWFKFQQDHWAKQPKPSGFRVPAGVTS